MARSPIGRLILALAVASWGSPSYSTPRNAGQWLKRLAKRESVVTTELEDLVSKVSDAS